MSKELFLADLKSITDYKAAFYLKLDAENIAFQRELSENVIPCVERFAIHEDALKNVLSEIKFKYKLSAEDQTIFETHCEKQGVVSDNSPFIFGYNEFRPKDAELYAWDDTNNEAYYVDLGMMTPFEAAICVGLCVTSPFWDSIDLDFYN